MTTTFENARVGDRVWCSINGWGIVSLIDKGSNYPIEVYFDNGQDDSYTFCGNAFVHSVWRTLFWDEVEIIAPPQPKRMKLVHGVEVPDISFTPSVGDSYYTPNIGLPDFYEVGWKSSEDCSCSERMVARGLCYPHTNEGRQAAILHTKAMLGIKPE